MKKTVVLLVLTINLAQGMELKEFTSHKPHVNPEVVAEVIKVPAISRALSDACVTPPLKLSDITIGSYSISTQTYSDSSAHQKNLSPNYYKTYGTTHENAIRSHSNTLFNIAYEANDQCNYKDELKQFIIEGPNKRGISIASARAKATDSCVSVATHVKSKSQPCCSNRMPNVFLWSLALSEGNQAIFSGIQLNARTAYLLCRKIKEQTVTSKFLGFNQTTHTLSWEPKHRSYQLDKNHFHVFDKMSFINEDLLIGLDQQGYLYSILPHAEELEHEPEFHKLTFNQNNVDFLKHFALDTYDKHNILLVDGDNNCYLGRIDAKNLTVKKMIHLKELLALCNNETVNPDSLRCIRLAGTVCYFIFAQKFNQDVILKAELVAKQLSCADKINAIKECIKSAAEQS